MKFEIITLCDAAEDQNGRLSIIGTFDYIFVTGVPCSLPNVTIALRARFARHEGRRHSLGMRFVDPDGEILTAPSISPLELVEDPVSPETAVNLIVKTNSLSVTHTGEHSFDFYLNDSLVARLPLIVVRAPAGGA